MILSEFHKEENERIRHLKTKNKNSWANIEEKVYNNLLFFNSILD